MTNEPDRDERNVALLLSRADCRRLDEMVEVSDWNREEDERIVAAIESVAKGIQMSTPLAEMVSDAILLYWLKGSTHQELGEWWQTDQAAAVAVEMADFIVRAIADEPEN